MNLQDYKSHISFRFIQPQTRLPKGYGEFSKLLRNLGWPMDVLNTRLPGVPANVSAALRDLCRMPRMSTIAIAALINWCVSQMPEDQVFVNVGVWHGFTFLSGIACNPQKTAIGVDNFSRFGGPRDAFLARLKRYQSQRHRFYEMDYRTYFQEVHTGAIGFYIYDGDHSYENQLNGLQVAESFMAPGGLMLVDDTNGHAARQATLDFQAANDRRYRVLLDEPTSRNCHPTFWDGIIVLEKVAK